jgi:hypothetical protein
MSESGERIAGSTPGGRRPTKCGSMTSMREIWKRARGNKGQTISEYMIVISVLAIAVVAVTYNPISDAFSGGSQDFQDKVTNAGDKGGFGVQNQR